MDGLAAVVKEHLRVDPFSGAIFVFRAKRADRPCAQRTLAPATTTDLPPFLGIERIPAARVALITELNASSAWTSLHGQRRRPHRAPWTRRPIGLSSLVRRASWRLVANLRKPRGSNLNV
jgi:hypothetical protein